jgi:hypothetical protein
MTVIGTLTGADEGATGWGNPMELRDAGHATRGMT